jgi:hypothetical protein
MAELRKRARTELAVSGQDRCLAAALLEKHVHFPDDDAVEHRSACSKQNWPSATRWSVVRKTYPV